MPKRPEPIRHPSDDEATKAWAMLKDPNLLPLRRLAELATLRNWIQNEQRRALQVVDHTEWATPDQLGRTAGLSPTTLERLRPRHR